MENIDFKKYNSITNHYNVKVFKDLIARNYDLLPTTIEFEITEKIHGANFSLLVEDEIQFARRNDVLQDDKFYGYKDVFDDTYTPLFDSLIRIANTYGTVQLYGELFGENIQKGVYYGSKRFLWYALRINGHLVTTKEADMLLEDIAYLKAPVIGHMVYDKTTDIEDFIENIPYRFTSRLTPSDYAEENICEGVVAVPYDIIPLFGDTYFAIKKKNSEFLEKKSEKRVRLPKEVSEQVQDVLEETTTYVNSIRTDDLMSKLGELEDIRSIGQYASAYFEDVITDFNNETDVYMGMSKEDQKEIKKKLSTLIFTELKRYLGA